MGKCGSDGFGHQGWGNTVKCIKSLKQCLAKNLCSVKCCCHHCLHHRPEQPKSQNLWILSGLEAMGFSQGDKIHSHSLLQWAPHTVQGCGVTSITKTSTWKITVKPCTCCADISKTPVLGSTGGHPPMRGWSFAVVLGRGEKRSFTHPVISSFHEHWLTICSVLDAVLGLGIRKWQRRNRPSSPEASNLAGNHGI